jgi:hypothetical protein
MHAVGPSDHVRHRHCLLNIDQLLGPHDGREDATLRLPEQLFRRGKGHESPPSNDGDLSRDGLDVRHDMRRENHDSPVRNLRQEIAEPDALLGIEPHGGLIDDDEPGISEESLGDPDPLPHPAGVTAELAVGGVMEVDQLQQISHAPVEVRARKPLEAPQVEQKLAGALPASFPPRWPVGPVLLQRAWRRFRDGCS